MMSRFAKRAVTALSFCVMAVGLFTVGPAAAQDGSTGCGSPRVTSDQPPLQNYIPYYAYDGKSGTFFATQWNDWQYHQVDFGCVGTFGGLRRMMSYGVTANGDRGNQGETVAYSVDGRTFTDVTAATTSGWEGYVTYRPNAWHSLNYGWSEELRLDVPVAARYVRFRWDGDPGDFLHELDIDFSPSPPEPTRSLGVSLRCEAGIVACEAEATGGSGGYTFAWRSGLTTRITSQSGAGSVSTIAGTCLGSTPYSVDVVVTDSSGSTASARASRACGRILL